MNTLRFYKKYKSVNTNNSGFVDSSVYNECNKENKTSLTL